MTATLSATQETPPRHADGLVIASVPAGHVYVRHLAPEPGTDLDRGPRRLPDPTPTRAPASSQAWWPPRMLEPSWYEHEDFDLFHLHFGFDACSPEHLTDFTEGLRRRGKPLVYTAHDLRNPHHEDRGLHDRQLDVLVRAADAVITLTEGAAREIHERWGVTAVVIAHPHVVALDEMVRRQAARAERPTGPFRVGLHVKSVRAGMAPQRVLPALVETVGALSDAVLQVNGHHDVLDADGSRYDAGLASYLREAAAAGLLELHVHDYFSDTELFDYLASLDVSVLPYRFGTHSGWSEMCRDLGTTVIAPTCGYIADQGPVLTYVHDEDEYDASSLAAAVVEAYDARPDFTATVETRRRQRREVAAAHDRVYRSVVADR